MKRLILILFSITSFCGFIQASPAVVELRNQAKTAFQSGDYDTATSLYKQLTETEPRRLNVLKECMWALWNMGRAEAAKNTAETVLTMQPDDTEAQKVLSWIPKALNREKIAELREKAKAAYQRGDYPEAAAAYYEITIMDPQNVSAHRDRMWLLWNAKRVGEAAEAAKKLLAIKPDDQDAKSVIARAGTDVRYAKSTQDVVRALESKLETDKDNVNATRQLAWTLFHKGYSAKAEGILKKFLKENPDNPDIWAQLGKIQQERGNVDGSIESFTKSLDLNPDQPGIMASMGKSYFNKRNLDESARLFERAVEEGGPASNNILPLLGKTLFYRGEYRRAADVWGQAVLVFPGRLDYRYFEIESLFFAGDQGRALDMMHRFKTDTKDKRAFDFLIDNAVARNDFMEAIQLSEERLETLTPNDGRNMIRLAEFYKKGNQLDQAAATLERWLIYTPKDIYVIEMLAMLEKERARYAESNRLHEKVLKLNPHVLDAHLGMASNYADMGEMNKSLAMIEAALVLRPDDPFVIREYASILYGAGQRKKARNVLVDWVGKNEKSITLPILLYHGLTATDSAPMLAHRIHSTISSFSSQIRALYQAGFKTVTMAQVAAWRAGEAELSPKPVFLTFDDARIDSFHYADPVIEQYGYQATMFVPLVNIESYGSIGFADWNQIRKYADTGRWLIESHGGLAHRQIPIDEREWKMFYLVMPQWLKESNRTETNEEWFERINQDHKLSKEKTFENIKYTPIGYAWPEGNYGHHSHAEQAIPNNMTSIREHFQFAFIQDEFGLNVRTQDPFFMYRYKPPKEMTGQALVEHIANKNPLVLAYRELLRMAIEEDHLKEANGWLAKLKAAGVTNSLYVAEKARLDYGSGNTKKAYQLALLSFTNNPTSVDAQQMMKEIKPKAGITWRPSFYGQADNEERSSWSFDQDLNIFLGSGFSLLLNQSYNDYRETGEENVKDNTLGGGLSINWGDGQELTGLVQSHSLSGEADDFVGAWGTYRSKWTRSFSTRFEYRRGLIGSARAINDDVRQHRYDALVHVGEKEAWGLTARGRLSDISDDNERRGVEALLGWPIFDRPGIGLVYRYGYEDTDRVDDNYYSPQQLNVHEFGPLWAKQISKKFKFYARYLPGFSKEKGFDTEFVQNVKCDLRWFLTPAASLAPSFAYEETGSYFARLGSVELEIHF